jgi:hypothetical protein
MGRDMTESMIDPIPDPLTEPTPAPDDPATEPGPDEPRGPHLPDRVTALPPLVWVFVALAIADLAWLASRVPTTGVSPFDLVLYGLNIVPSVAAILLPAALLWRHRDAMSRARTLLFGTMLYASVEGLQILSEPLQPVFERLTPPSDDLQFLVPMAAAYSGLVSLVASFGLLYIAVGLSRARRYEDASGSIVALVVPLAAALALASGLLTISRIPFGDTVITPTVIVYLAAQLILGVITIVAWAYLMVSAWRGVRVGEVPRLGWGLAALAGGLIILAVSLASVRSLIATGEGSLNTTISYLTLAGYSFGHLLLLLAFAVGLPSLEDLPEDDDEPLDDAEAIDDGDGDADTDPGTDEAEPIGDAAAR